MKIESTKESHLWEINYRVLNCYLDFYREKGVWITTNQSWNLARWNIYGNVLISEKAISLYLDNKDLDKDSKAVNWNGRKGSRCFVAEHVVPFKIVKKLYLKKFIKENPSYDEYRNFFLKFNRLCYVWHEEDINLKDMGLNSDVPDFENIEYKIFNRYEKCGIKYVETHASSGRDLFKQLKDLRSKSINLNEAIKAISIKY